MLAALLDVSVSALAGTEGVREPIVAYRVKRTRKVKEEQAAWIKRDVLWLRVLEKRMSMSGWMERPPEHRGAATDEQTRLVATSFRHELGLHDDDEVIPAHRLLSWIATHGICLVPVLWGAKEQPLQAMYVRMPDSEIHWLYASLDATVVDIRFWLLHEIAHIIRRHPHDAEGSEEMFADTFAAEVLFPMKQATDFLHIREAKDPNTQMDILWRLAAARGISPVTMYRQVNHALERAQQPRLELDALVYPRALSQSKQTPTWADALFGGQPPTGRHFVDVCSERLHTPVFRLAAREIVENNRGYGFVERVFQCSASDAMALHAVLREYATSDTRRS